MARAMASDFQYDRNAATAAIGRAMAKPTTPPPPRMKSKAADDEGDEDDEAGDEERGAALVLGDLLVQGVGLRTQNCDLDGAAGLVVGLEVLALGEAEPLGDHDRRGTTGSSCYSLIHGVVVELPGVGDAALGAGQLLLQVAGSSGSP